MMTIRMNRNGYASSAAGALLCVLVNGACAETLALSPELSLTPPAPQSPIVRDRCATNDLLAASCDGARDKRFTWNAWRPGASDARRPGDAGPAIKFDAALLTEALTRAYPAAFAKPIPLAADSVYAEARALLMLDSLSAPAETTFRLTARDRLRNVLGGLEPQRFTDARSEAWSQRSKLTWLSLELLFPFD